MAYTITKVNVWTGSLRDRPGGLAEKLNALAKSRANLEFLIARRDRPGRGIIFLAPLKTASQTRGAKKVRLRRAAKIYSLRLLGPNRRGLGAKITNALAKANINLRGLSAVSLQGRCVVYFAFDKATDANKAARILKQTLR